MKRIILTVVIISMLAIGLTASGHGDNKPAKPLIDLLIQPPNSTWQTYGYSPDTLRLYNIVAIRVAAQRNESKIKLLWTEITSLRTEIAKLKKTLKNLEAIVEINAQITTLITADMVDDIKVEVSDPNALKE